MVTPGVPLVIHQLVDINPHQPSASWAIPSRCRCHVAGRSAARGAQVPLRRYKWPLGREGFMNGFLMKTR